MPHDFAQVATEHNLYLQGCLDGATLLLLIAFFDAVWIVRSTVLGSTTGSQAVLAALIVSSVRCPWLLATMPSLDRAARRALRVRPPIPIVGAFVYRADGSSRMVGEPWLGVYIAGWGAACWSPESAGFGHPSNTSAGIATGTNNMAEFEGLRAIVAHALSTRRAHVVFELDSLLLVKFMNGEFGCHAPNLRGLFEECRQLGNRLSSNGIKWSVRHIYREFNTVADELSKRIANIPWSPE
jgi:ribonuclease HI